MCSVSFLLSGVHLRRLSESWKGMPIFIACIKHMRERKGKACLIPLLPRHRAGKEHECLSEAPGKSWRKDATSITTRPRPSATVKAFLRLQTAGTQHFPQAAAREAAREQTHVSRSSPGLRDGGHGLLRGGWRQSRWHQHSVPASQSGAQARSATRAPANPAASAPWRPSSIRTRT